MKDMLDKLDNPLGISEIREIFTNINTELEERGLTATIYVYGGVAIMLSCYDALVSFDMDVIIDTKHHSIFWQVVNVVGKKMELHDNYMNEDVLPIVQGDLLKESVVPSLQFSNLNVSIPSKRQLLAMKLYSSRLEEDSRDLLDAIMLSKEEGVSSRSELEQILKEYVKPSAIKQRNRKKGSHNGIYTFMDKLLEEMNHGDNRKVSIATKRTTR